MGRGGNGGKGPYKRERESKFMHLSLLHWSTYFPQNILSISLKLGSTVSCVKSTLWEFGQDLVRGTPINDLPALIKHQGNCSDCMSDHLKFEFIEVSVDPIFTNLV